ncbi:PHB depolymerase family esterase [Chenggangzhangella methanolivorans]|uniref:PHB depolymerase family esterase n=2 Tax=Chenggangzhangella methanolivorans TaxID=1437009 RepID=A0A9E6UJH7_9HYPH|nr:PHB depolymerase family esterase [Chenggangzhangella methanolivorans]
MNTAFAAAMRRASKETRAQNLVEATRLIQAVLAGRPEVAAAPDAASGAKAIGADDARWSQAAGLSLGDALRHFKGGLLTPDPFAKSSGASGSKTRGETSVPGGARFETRDFVCAAGARSYRLYIPASAPARPRGLIVMLHGCTQNPDDFARGTGMNDVAETRGFAVAYPGQTRSDNANGCWNWFEPKHQGRGAGEPAILAGLTQFIVAEFGIDPSQVFVAGLSAGGAMAAVLGETYPELYAAVGVHSGLPTHTAKDVASAFAAMGGGGKTRESQGAPRYPGRTIVFQGGADKTVHPSNATKILDAATPDAASISTRRVPAGEARHRPAAITTMADQAGDTIAELWLVEGAGHAWSGGKAGGSFVDPMGPDASLEMMRFFTRKT